MRTVHDTRGILDPRRGAEHFALTRHAPASELAGRVARHWIVRWDLRGRAPYTAEVLPHPCVNLAFVNGEGRLWGVAPEKDRRRLEGRGAVVGTKFRPGGFQGFAPHLSQRGLVGGSLTVAEAFGPDGARLQRDVRAMGDDVVEQATAVDAFLAARVPAPDPAFELVAEVAADMLRCPIGARVAELAAGHGVAPRTLQRLFDRYVGAGPKWVLQRYRLHIAAERMAAGEDDLTRLALDLGYFDLPHFTRHFGRAVGVTPTAFVEACAVR